MAETAKKLRSGGFNEDGGKFLGFLNRDTVGPLLLVAACPALAVLLWHVICELDGSGLELFRRFGKHGPMYLFNNWPSPVDPVAWKLLGSYAVFQLALMRLVPGKRFEATTTATGHTPVYKANGMASYVINLLTFLVLVGCGWDAGIVYDKLGEILSGLSLFSLLFCAMLYFKGLYAPSTADSGTTGKGPIQDYFWGTELYPRILGWDVKQFTNCRFGMMYWAMGLLCYAHKSATLNTARPGEPPLAMCVSVFLQLVYIAKFFHWEMGYMCTMDIQHDRAGYYICWGCLVWVPAVYTSSGMYLVRHSPDLSIAAASVITVIGVLSIWANYDADRQRQHFRAVNGKCSIWGKPAEMIVATWDTGNDGSAKFKQSLLLCSGWWGLSRHFHYVTEIAGAFCWSVPALFTHIAPYFYVIFLTILLVDRSFRDDARCKAKYGKDWSKYCERVPYKIVPGIL